jgi:hypothetical protein
MASALAACLVAFVAAFFLLRSGALFDRWLSTQGYLFHQSFIVEIGAIYGIDTSAEERRVKEQMAASEQLIRTAFAQFYAGFWLGLLCVVLLQ